MFISRLSRLRLPRCSAIQYLTLQYSTLLTWFILLGFLVIWIVLPRELRAYKLSQSLLMEYQVMEKNRYYINGEKTNEYNNVTGSNNYRTFQQHYLIRSKTGFHHPYFAVILDYSFLIKETRYLNAIGSEIDFLRTEASLHSFQPSVFGQYRFIRLGVSYNYLSEKQLTTDTQVWRLLPSNYFSTHIQLYFPELWEDGPIGLSGSYQLAMDLGAGDPWSKRYQYASFGFHVNFNYYGQFEILMSYVQLDGDFYFSKIASNTEMKQYYRSYIKRYFADAVYTFQILKSTSLTFGVGQLLYSAYESPMTRFHFGVTYLHDL